jgi:hypothetical protein
MQEIESLKNSLADQVGFISPHRIFDDSIGSIVYQVRCEDEWIEATHSIFRSWTGFRRINGEEYHGPVYEVGSRESDEPYTGYRACGCSVCQAHVVAKFKKN